jgi:hypothetical protein
MRLLRWLGREFQTLMGEFVCDLWEELAARRYDQGETRWQ